MRLTCDVVTDALPSEECARVAQLVADGRFFDLPANVEGIEHGADRFEYSISIDAGSGTHSVRVGESALPDSLRPLVTWLTTAVRNANNP